MYLVKIQYLFQVKTMLLQSLPIVENIPSIDLKDAGKMFSLLLFFISIPESAYKALGGGWTWKLSVGVEEGDMFSDSLTIKDERTIFWTKRNYLPPTQQTNYVGVIFKLCHFLTLAFCKECSFHLCPWAFFHSFLELRRASAPWLILDWKISWFLLETVLGIQLQEVLLGHSCWTTYK